MLGYRRSVLMCVLRMWWIGYTQYSGIYYPGFCDLIVRSPSSTQALDKVKYDGIPLPDIWVLMSTISILCKNLGVIRV